MRTAIRILLLTVLGTAAGMAEEEKANEAGLLLGGIVTSDASVAAVDMQVDKGLSFQAAYARLLAGNRIADWYLEFPFVATPSTEVNSATLGQVPTNYASLFITPAIRVKFVPERQLSPWATIGYGYGRFDESTTREDETPNVSERGTNTGVFQFGGGVDIRTPLKIGVPISLRGEVRDFYSGNPNYAVTPSSDRQHNVVFSGGFVIHF
jgi:opacity protein-like surface antigen